MIKEEHEDAKKTKLTKKAKKADIASSSFHFVTFDFIVFFVFGF